MSMFGRKPTPAFVGCSANVESKGGGVEYRCYARRGGVSVPYVDLWLSYTNLRV